MKQIIYDRMPAPNGRFCRKNIKLTVMGNNVKSCRSSGSGNDRETEK